MSDLECFIKQFQFDVDYDNAHEVIYADDLREWFASWQAAQAQAVCPHVVTSGTTSWCRLAQSSQAQAGDGEADTEGMDEDDAMFAQIEEEARRTYRRHRFSVRGQMITRSDAYESHLAWAAMKWALQHRPPQPAVNQQLLEALEDARSALRYIRETHGELYGVGFDRVETNSTSAIAAAQEQSK